MTVSPYQVRRDDATFESLGEFLKRERMADRSESCEPIGIEIAAVPAEPLLCPNCQSPMVGNGTAVRTLKEGIRKYVFRVRVCLCPKCKKVRDDKTTDACPQYTQRVLPSEVHPYKRTPAEVLFACGELGEEEKREPPDAQALEKAQNRWNEANSAGYDGRTQSRWKQWFVQLKTQIAGILRSMGRAMKMPALTDMAKTLAGGRSAPGQPEKAVRKLLKLRGRLSI